MSDSFVVVPTGRSKWEGANEINRLDIYTSWVLEYTYSIPMMMLPQVRSKWESLVSGRIKEENAKSVITAPGEDRQDYLSLK